MIDRDVWDSLSEEKRPIVVYGMGNGAEKIINMLSRYGVKISAVMASDGFVRGQEFLGHTVQTLYDIDKKYPDPVILVSFGSSRTEVIENIFNIAKTHTVLAPDVPVYGDNYFTYEFYKENREKLETVREALADDCSRETLDAVIEFKLSGDIERLKRVFSPKNTVFGEIIGFGENESFLDLGAYRGDTVEEFIANTHGRYEYITALEPDRKTYKKLKEYLAAVPQSRAFNMGIWDEDKTVDFNSSLGRGSAINDNGKDRLMVTTIDTLYKKRRLSYLKMDVEGAERRALVGGKTVIARDRPKINMALYHRSEDIFDLPLLLREIRPDYKLFIRQHPHIPAWDLNLYAV